MNAHYMEDLRLLKGTFDPGNEATIIADAIAEFIPKRRIQLLDVGIGEGQATFQAVDSLLSRGWVVHLTGIDLHIPQRIWKYSTASTSLLEADFLSLPATETFDAVIATQSLYYLGNIDAALKKLIAHTVSDGCLLVTAWTNNCILHDLHSYVVQVPELLCLTAEDIAEKLRNMVGDAHITIVRTVGQVDVGKIAGSETLCKAAYRILSRSEEYAESDMASYVRFKSHLKHLSEHMVRENATVVFQRAVNRGRR